MKKILASLAAVALASGSAFAADLPPAPAPVYKAPAAVAPAYSWSGCYVDGGGGYGLWDQDHTFQAGGVPSPLGSTSTGGRGWFGSVGGGCDYQVSNNWVIGVQGDYNFMNIHGTFTDPFAAVLTGNEKESWSWGAGGRIGYLVSPNVLAYFNGGYTQAHFNQITSSFAPADTVAAHTYNGWFLGGGTETSLAGFLGLGLPPGLFLRSEYRFSSYQAADVPILVGGLPVGDTEHMTNYVQTIGTELLYKFNWH